MHASNIKEHLCKRTCDAGPHVVETWHSSLCNRFHDHQLAHKLVLASLVAEASKTRDARVSTCSGCSGMFCRTAPNSARTSICTDSGKRSSPCETTLRKLGDGSACTSGMPTDRATVFHGTNKHGACCCGLGSSKGE